MRTNHRLLFLLLSILFLLNAQPATASYLRCLARSQGGYLKWDSNWQKDNQDHGAYYKVVRAIERDRMPDREVTLTLQAATRASIRSRKVVADAEDIAGRYCRALVQRLPRIGRPSLTKNDPGSINHDHPFIRYIPREGWVRADPPLNEGLVTCIVQNKRFSCLQEERRLYGSLLETLAQQLSAEVELWQSTGE